jgi:hypothetical protein
MRTKTMGSIAVLVLVAASLASAQSDRPAQERVATQETRTNVTVTGEVVSVSPTMLTIRSSDGRNMNFTVTRDWTTGANPVRVGDRVRVEYRGEDTFEAVVVSALRGAGEALEDAGEAVADAGEAVADRLDPDDDNGVQSRTAADPDDSAALPETAGPLPLLLLAGLSLLGGGLGLSLRRS